MSTETGKHDPVEDIGSLLQQLDECNAVCAKLKRLYERGIVEASGPAFINDHHHAEVQTHAHYEGREAFPHDHGKEPSAGV